MPTYTKSPAYRNQYASPSAIPAATALPTHCPWASAAWTVAIVSATALSTRNVNDVSESTADENMAVDELRTNRPSSHTRPIWLTPSLSAKKLRRKTLAKVAQAETSNPDFSGDVPVASTAATTSG